ncbi:cytochrome P450 [Streptosporangium fragile]|uniref:cytochrome P450 n=1 Tax=Streptosporangium fragile TaxID=46186 RepID=UPI003CD09004
MRAPAAAPPRPVPRPSRTFRPRSSVSPTRPAPPRDALFAFGGGARKCIGDVFARSQLTLSLATIAGRWRLELLPDDPPAVPARSSLLTPKTMRLRLVSRHRDAAQKPSHT